MESHRYSNFPVGPRPYRLINCCKAQVCCPSGDKCLKQTQLKSKLLRFSKNSGFQVNRLRRWSLTATLVSQSVQEHSTTNGSSGAMAATGHVAMSGICWLSTGHLSAMAISKGGVPCKRKASESLEDRSRRTKKNTNKGTTKGMCTNTNWWTCALD
jgi:hypothetical protein